MKELLWGGMADTAAIRLAVFSVYLGICAVQDSVKQKISVSFSVIAGILMLLLDLPLLVSGGTDAMFWAAAFLPGIFLLCLSRAAAGAAGTGDGICFLILGGLLGPRIVGTLVMASLLLASLTGIFLLIRRKAGRKTHLPFLLFTGIAWAGELLIHICRIEW